MSHIELTDYTVKQLASKIYTSIQLLEKYSRGGDVTHSQRNAVEKVVEMILKDVLQELNARAADPGNDIPF